MIASVPPARPEGESDRLPEPIAQSTVRRATLIAVVYALVGAAWIFGSDFITGNTDGHQSVVVSTIKGLFYIALTAVALFLAVRAALQHERRLTERLSSEAIAAQEARTAAQRDRAFINAVFDSIEDRIFVFGADGRIRRANAVAWRGLGRTGPPEGELSLEESGFPEAARGELLANIARVLATGETVNGQTRYWEGGACFTMEHSDRPFADPATGRVDVLSIAHDITAAVASAELLARKNRTLTALVSGLLAIQGETDRKGLARAVTRALVESGFALSYIADLDDGPQSLRLLAASGDLADKMPAVIKAIRTRPDVLGPTITAIRTREPFLCNDLGDEPEFDWARELLGPNDLSSCVVVPMLFSGRPIGVLTVCAREALVFTPEDLSPLAAFADQLGRALTTLDSYVRYEKSEAGRLVAQSRLKEALIETVGALASIVEVRDPYTAGHQRKVGTLAVEIARELGWPQDRIEGVRIGALLHDIGKIAVPTELLTKPGKLKTEEFALIKTHAARGGELLRGIRFDWPIHEMVTQHHERLDGSGYPAGLKGDQIAEEAKLLAVADVTEAMLAYRPYRQAIPVEIVLAELTQGRGRLYDPASVDIAMRLIRERGTSWFQESAAA